MWIYIGIAIAIIFMMMLIYSCCAMSGYWDEVERQRHLMEEWQNEHRTKD